MGGIAERIKDAQQVHGDPRIGMPDIRDRDAQVLGKCAGPVHSHSLGVFAEMATTRQTIATPSADNMPFAGHNVSNFKVVDVAANRGDGPDKLVAHHHRHRDGFLRPGIPIPNVDICTTDSRFVDSDQDIVDSTLGNWYILQPQTGFLILFDQGFHRFPHDLNDLPFEECSTGSGFRQSYAIW
jgi:hypothetical protein